MKVLVNGETRELPGALKLHELLERLEMPKQRVAVELNHAVVRRKDWEATVVNENDKIEIVHFVGGG